jgi:DNA-binding NtrC family response regulator
MARVLVVDDEAEVRAVLRRMLARLGHEVWDVPDGVEALRVLEAVSIELVISDVYMTAVDGVELLVRMQQRELRMPVVVMSGGGYRSSKEVLAMAEGCGAAATLPKPFTAQQLRETIEPLLPPPPAAQGGGPHA